MSKIENIIVRGEGKSIEFKVSLPRGDNLARTVIAFSNMAGGKILQVCREAGLRDPEFRESGLFFKVTLYKDNRLESKNMNNSRISSQKTSQKDSQKIIEFMKGNPAITIRELSLSIGLSDRGVKNHIHKLKNQGRIRRIGPDRGGHWEVVEKKHA